MSPPPARFLATPHIASEEDLNALREGEKEPSGNIDDWGTVTLRIEYFHLRLRNCACEGGVGRRGNGELQGYGNQNERPVLT